MVVKTHHSFFYIDHFCGDYETCSFQFNRVPGYHIWILYGMSSTNINKLQRVQNSLARVVTGARRYDHITPVLADLHWLKIQDRITF